MTEVMSHPLESLRPVGGTPLNFSNLVWLPLPTKLGWRHKSTIVMVYSAILMIYHYKRSEMHRLEASYIPTPVLMWRFCLSVEADCSGECWNNYLWHQRWNKWYNSTMATNVTNKHYRAIKRRPHRMRLWVRKSVVWSPIPQVDQDTEPRVSPIGSLWL